MLVGTKEVSLSFFLFCCSASSLALASSVEMMFFIFALEEKQRKKYSCVFRKGSRQRRAQWMDFGVVTAQLWYLMCFLRQTLCFKGRREADIFRASSDSAGHKLFLQQAARFKSQEFRAFSQKS